MTMEWKVSSLSPNNTTATKQLNGFEADGWIIYQILDTRVVLFRDRSNDEA